MNYHHILGFLQITLLYFWLFEIRIYQLTSFNPDPSKQAEEVIFSCEIKKPSHPVLIFNNNQVIQTPYQKHLGSFLNEKLNFGEQLVTSCYLLVTSY